jgi:hypothetical protein
LEDAPGIPGVAKIFVCIHQGIILIGAAVAESECVSFGVRSIGKEATTVGAVLEVWKEESTFSWAA